MYNETYDDYIRSILGYPNYGVTYQQAAPTAYERNDQNIDELTNEIYLSIESDNEINVTINLTNEVGSEKMPSNSKNLRKEEVRENRGEDRQFRNKGLQDLIRILLIRELLGRPGRPGNRPPMPPPRPPMRPPFPPGGPGTGPRPPIMPRDL